MVHHYLLYAGAVRDRGLEQQLSGLLSGMAAAWARASVRRPDWTGSRSPSSGARIRPFWASSWYASHPVKATDGATTPQRSMTIIQWAEVRCSSPPRWPWNAITSD